MVRATFSARCVLRADQPRRAAAVLRNLAAVSSCRCRWVSISWPCSAWLVLPCRASATARALRHAFADCLRWLRPRVRLHQLVGGQGGHLHMQVNAVQQRAAELGLVAVHLVGRAAARALGGAQVAAGAGVHGRDHLEPGREIRTLRRSGDGDVSCLQRFAQGLQRSTRKLGQSRPETRFRCAPTKFRRACGGDPPPTRATALAVWCGAAVGLWPHSVGAKAPGQAGNGGALQRLVHGHRGQQPRKPQRQHRLARTRAARP